MSDRPDRPAADQHPASAGPVQPKPSIAEATRAALSEEPIPPVAPTRAPDYRGLALGLAAALLLVLALVGTAPLWAPLLPWGAGRSGLDPAVIERLDAAQRQIDLLRQQLAAATAAMPQLEQRIGAVEQKPAVPPDLNEARQQIAAVSAGTSDLTTRLERLENSVQAQAAGFADLKTGLARLDRTQQGQTAEIADLKTGLEQLGKAQQTQAADLAAGLGPLRQGLQTQQSAYSDLRSRVQALEKTAQTRAGDMTDVGLALALLQIRNAVETGRPFPAEYAALSSLARTRPEIAEATAPLAEAAPTGVADRDELTRGLQALAQQIEAAPAAIRTDDGWAGAVLDRLRGLVRIRRADEAEPAKEAAATVGTAERALAGGDLARAVAAVETLHGPAFSEAAAWLHRARERLAVETSLQQLEALLTARLGDTDAMPGAPG